MLFCQLKNVNRPVAIGIPIGVFMVHCFVIWLICLKTTVHYLTIPLSGSSHQIKIKLNKSASVIKKQSVRSVQKSNNKKSISTAQQAQKNVTKESSKKSSLGKIATKQSIAKKAFPEEAKITKPAVKQVQKVTQKKGIKETEIIKKPTPIPVVDSVIHNPITKVDSGDKEIPTDDMNVLSCTDYYDVVYATITERWRPPIGIVGGTSCSVAFTIDKTGLPTDIIFEKKSGVLMFDMSIKAVLASVTFSPLFVGNRFSIVFTV